MTGSSKFWTWALTGTLTLLIVAALNLFIDVFQGQWDLTEDDRYTLPEAAKAIAAKFEDSCIVKCYVSTSLPPALGHVPRALRTRLEEFRTASGKQLEFRFIDPEEEGEDFKNELQSRGIQPNRFQHMEGGKRVDGVYYLALDMSYLDQEESLDLIKTLSRAMLYESEMLRALPYALCSKFVKMMNPDPTVGIVADKKIAPQQIQQPQGPFPREATDTLEGLRGAITTNLAAPSEVTIKSGKAIPEELSAVVVYRPDNLTEREVFEIDQALMKGKSVAILLDNYASIELDRFMQDYFQQMQRQSNSRFKAREVNHGLGPWLAHFGVDVGKGYVESLACAVRRWAQPVLLPNGRIGTKQNERLFPACVLVTERAGKETTGQFSDSDPAFSGLGQVAVFAPAPLQMNTAALAANHDGVVHDVVLKTSSDSYVREATGGWLPVYDQGRQPPPPPEERRSYPIAISLRGSFKSFFAGKTYGADNSQDRPPLKAADGSDRPPLPDEEPRIDESLEPGQLWIFADADFCNDAYLVQRFGLAQAMGTPQAMQGAQRMVLGLLNVINNLTAGKELVEIRKPSLTDRSLDTQRVEEERGSIRFIAVWLMPLTVIAFGLVWWIFRSLMTRVPSPSLDAGPPAFAGGRASPRSYPMGKYDTATTPPPPPPPPEEPPADDSKWEGPTS